MAFATAILGAQAAEQQKAQPPAPAEAHAPSPATSEGHPAAPAPGDGPAPNPPADHPNPGTGTPAAQDPEDDPAGPRYSFAVHRQDIMEVLRAFAKRTGKPMSFPDLPLQLVSLEVDNLPFYAAFRQILQAGHLDYRLDHGTFVVGLPIDLKVRYPQPGEQTLDAAYRCQRVGADSLANALKAILPDLKISTGPLFLSPTLESSSGTADSQTKALGATDASFRTHDVLISGPADMVRRALDIAQKFDRSRQQVRIAIKVVAMDHNAAQNLGVAWMTSLTVSATEQSPGSVPGSSTGGTGPIPGLRVGTFAHSPLTVNATLNAMEERGQSRTLTSPTLTLLDGERAFILNGEKYFYPKYTGKDQAGQSIYDIAEQKIGVYLQVGVQIGDDNDMVLSLYPQITSILASRTINGAEYPTVGTAEEHTTVRATSGEMVVLGGMVQDSSSNKRVGLPWLGRIPLLGSLFSSAVSSKDKNELMIFLTPELVGEARPRGDVAISVSSPAPQP